MRLTQRIAVIIAFPLMLGACATSGQYSSGGLSITTGAAGERFPMLDADSGFNQRARVKFTAGQDATESPKSALDAGPAWLDIGGDIQVDYTYTDLCILGGLR